MEEYNALMAKTMRGLKKEGFTTSCFGDIFLEDLRNYRIKRLKEVGFKASFPLWKRNTTKLINEFLDLGFQTIIVCVNDNFLDKNFVGRVIDKEFLADLPKGVDPCGENGEFHTFTFNAPFFKKPIKFDLGAKVYRKYKKPKNNEDTCEPNPKKNHHTPPPGFWFADLIAKE